MKFVLIWFISFLATTLGQDVVQVICTNRGMTGRIQKELVTNAGYTMGDLHFNDKSCVFDQDDGEFFAREISPLNSCGTLYTVNDTHVEFTNSISSVETGSTFPYGVVVGGPPNNRVLSAIISCTYAIELHVSTLFTPNISFVTIKMPDAYGEGEFQAGMSIYEDGSYQRSYETPPIMDSDATLYIGSYLIGNVSEDIHLLMEDCWGTVSDDPQDSPRYPLIEEGCPVTSSADGLVRIAQNGVGHQGLWNSPVFKFVGDGEAFDDVWLHCDLQICINEPCQPTCPAQRKRRSLGNGDTFGPDDFTTPYIITLGPITRIKVTHISSNHARIPNIEVEEIPETDKKVDPNNESDLTPVAIGIIASLGAVVVLCFVVAIVVVARMRASRSRGFDLGDGISNKAFS